jgi:uncharacterized protein
VKSHEAIEQLTLEYGGRWGLEHSRRLLSLAEEIGRGLEYDREAVWLAAQLHDWGAYERWAEAGVDHAARSRQVAEQFLREEGHPPEKTRLVLECIEFHHGGPAERSLESVILTDADALDFLGVTGVLRDFAKNPRDLRKAFEASRARLASLPGVIMLEASRRLMQVRLERMKQLLADFEAETGGLF